ncbi:hypothetical protein L284_20635 [Novosphingobium lindaniclasticum LE124]|uniref:Uncharacterized protein n=1 Tax=Novosphingobium lindaniclasticum LE124 TaxID=1096930 RepID=T0IH41_9SPHN|nr:hypothetical protein L284_20635 [Novosphingobium lindaniclasticum LE124]
MSASGSARGEFEHAKNCAHTATALSGVGWQGGNWLLISRVNLFDPERIFRFLTAGLWLCRSCSGTIQVVSFRNRRTEASWARVETA